MSNKMFAKGLCSFLFLATGSLHASEEIDSVAYTQNNLPRQHQSMGAFSKDTPIIINADLLYGRATTDQGFYGARADNASANQRTTQEFFDWPNQSKFGFRVGLGVGLGQNVANLSVQYTWLRSKDSERKYPTTTAPFLIILGSSVVSASSNANPNLYASQNLRYQTLDVVVQAAAWMLGSKTRFQPLGGIRYMYFRNHQFAQLTGDNFQQDNLPFVRNRYKIHATGPFIGTDIKFIVYRTFHFFTNIMLGILSGHDRRTIVANQTQTPPLLRTEKLRGEITFDPFWEARFGFGWSHMFDNDWLLSLRIAFELMSLIRNSAPVLTIGTPDLSVIKTQAVLFGFTLTF